jgi:hypothetical protein
MKVAIAIIGTVAALFAVLFLVFRFLKPGPAVATTPSQALAPAPAMPKSAATDKSAQRIGAIADIISATGSLATSVGFKL